MCTAVMKHTVLTGLSPVLRYGDKGAITDSATGSGKGGGGGGGLDA